MDCPITDCPNQIAKAGLCYSHLNRLKTKGDVLADVPIRKYWQVGDPITDVPISYNAAHYRVTKVRGKASEYMCANQCGSQAIDWSYVGGSVREQSGLGKGKPATWSPDPQDYVARCRACHNHEDITHALEVDPTYVPLTNPADAPRTPVTDEVAEAWGYPTGWLSCAVQECDKPAKRNRYDNPRRLCSAHQKDREAARNVDQPCTADGCELPRFQARLTCRWHTFNGIDAVMSPATLKRSVNRRNPMGGAA